MIEAATALSAFDMTVARETREINKKMCTVWAIVV
jgi:hypothetical protein